jgi:nucleoside-diphosphate-sugar epimerase
MILVTGATGTNGRLVVQALLRAGTPVRAMVQDPARAADLQQAGAQLFVADFIKKLQVETWEKMEGHMENFKVLRGDRGSPGVRGVQLPVRDPSPDDAAREQTLRKELKRKRGTA